MHKITIDPGHGGTDIGSIYEELVEKDIVLTIALKCCEELVRHGIQVQMTRSEDINIELQDRIYMANTNESEYFISIHCNEGGGCRGEVIYSIHNGKGLELTNKISSEMMKIGQNAVKTYNRIGVGGVDYFEVIRETNMDAVIVECAFLDNENDNKIINTMEKQKSFGVGIAKGILKQINIDYDEDSIDIEREARLNMDCNVE